MRKLRQLVALVGLLALVGCDPILSTRSWFHDADYVAAPEIEGTWAAEDGSPVLTITRDGECCYTLTFTDEGKTSRYSARVVRRGRFYLLDLKSNDTAAEALLRNEFWLPLAFFHFLGRIELDGDVLVLSYFANLKGAIQSGEIDLPHQELEGNLLLLTAETDELCELAHKYAEDQSDAAFEKIERFHRQPEEVGFFYEGKQYTESGRHLDAERAYRAALNRKPDYSQAHAWLGLNYLFQGFAEESLASLEQAVALDRNNAEHHVYLAGGLLFAERYEQARTEARIALQLGPERPEPLALIGVAYFAEKRFAEAARAFEEYEEAGDGPLSAAIITHTLALKHQGRDANARALVVAQRNRNAPSGWPRYLLNEIAEEQFLRDNSYGNQQRCQSRFLIGYMHYLRGDFSAASRHFQEALAAKCYLEFEYFLARIRLREMGG
jgi:Flp pilus assembly protein TadD